MLKKQSRRHLNRRESVLFLTTDLSASEAVKKTRMRTWASRSDYTHFMFLRARQQDHISCHSREVDIADADLILQTARKSAAIYKHIRTEVFMLRDFSHHVN